MTQSNPTKPKLQKFLASAGLCSRRKGELLILDGLISINGKKAKLGDRVNVDHDIVKFKGNRINANSKPSVTLIVNKPKGYMCSNEDINADRLIFELLEQKYRTIRLFCAGRLDVDSEGMVVLTNDGDLAHRLTHPSQEVRKKYKIEIDKNLDTDVLPSLLNGEIVEDEFLKIDEIKPRKGKSLRSRKLDIVMQHGKKREIRRIFFYLGYRVTKLKRVSIGGLGIRNMSLGQSRLLKKEEIDLLFPKKIS
ncbi:MAG: RNA-binding protein [Opitutae bacterium]|nr:RNA-binding protein [Opitutae bacterium]